MKTSDRERRKAHRHRVQSARTASGGKPVSGEESLPVAQPWGKAERKRLAVGVAILGSIFAWSYWPTLVSLVGAWDREPDYSHGFFVVPVALYFLWARREHFPGGSMRLAWPGLVLIGLSIGVRMLGSRLYLEAMDGWSILLWVAGVAWLLGGWRVAWWSLPSVAFLWFMVPLPWRVERWLSLPLQRVATKISCWALQCLGQPAFADGNTILINEFHLEVEQACSGLRIFVGIVALAFVYFVLVRRAWWEKALLMISVIPIALVANSTRIVVTGLLYQYASGEAAHKFSHDVAGYVMIPFAAGLFAMMLWYLGTLVREVELLDVGTIVRREHV